MTNRAEPTQIDPMFPNRWEEGEGVASGMMERTSNLTNGTGLSRVQKLAQSGGDISEGARSILSSLLQEPGAWHFETNMGGLEDTGLSAPVPVVRCAFDPLSHDVPTSELAHTDVQTIVELAKEGRLSLFCSILRLFRDSRREISTQIVIRACSHAIRPADVPPDMDAKEEVMAALHFLSSRVPELDAESHVDNLVRSYDSFSVTSLFPSLPLLSANSEENLDRRCYVKSGNWSMKDADFRRKVILLERAFSGSTEANPSRLRMCPRLEDREAEAKLMASGTLPAASKTKAGLTAKKK